VLERNKKPLYYCRRLTPTDTGYQDGMELFEPPVQRYLNYKSLDGETSLVTTGEVNTKNLIAKLYDGTDQYEEKDRCYVYKAPSVPFDAFCNDADYVIKSVLPEHNVVEIVFERIVGS